MSYNTCLVATSARSANDAVEQASLAAQALALLSAAVQTINDMNTQIAAAVEERARVTEGISRLIQGVEEETAQGANQAASASCELTELASGLQQLVQGFRLESEGRSAHYRG